MKPCNGCGLMKPLSEYHKHKACADGHVGTCKACARIKEAEYRKTEAFLISRRKSSQKEPHKARQSEYKKSEAGKAAQAKGSKRFVERNPKQAYANWTFQNAVKLGKITRLPCFVCGELKSEGHHPDYDLPLSVIWLCRKHHLEVHALARKVKRDERTNPV